MFTDLNDTFKLAIGLVSTPPVLMIGVALWVNKPNVVWNVLVSNETNEDVRMYT